MFLNIFDRRELFAQIFGEVARYLVFTHADRFRHIFECVFCNKVIFALAKKQTNRRIVVLGLQNSIYGRKIEVKLTGIIRLELTCFQLNNDVAA